jgi:hypothetical protein
VSSACTDAITQSYHVNHNNPGISFSGFQVLGIEPVQQLVTPEIKIQFVKPSKVTICREFQGKKDKHIGIIFRIRMLFNTKTFF